MRYERIVQGVFLKRVNRFIALCGIEGKQERVHVRNTGRCAELFLPKTQVFLQYAPAPGKKTAYTLIAIRKGRHIVNLDSLAPNKLVLEFLGQGGLWPGMDEAAQALHGEVVFGDSRLDCAFTVSGRQAYAEVKGVTLEVGGKAYFPDAPTLRGVRHVRELCAARKAGALAYLILVCQMEKVESFAPNYATHPEFAAALREAESLGVEILAYRCRVAPDEIEMGKRIPVELGDRSSEAWKQ